MEVKEFVNDMVATLVPVISKANGKKKLIISYYEDSKNKAVRFEVAPTAEKLAFKSSKMGNRRIKEQKGWTCLLR